MKASGDWISLQWKDWTLETAALLAVSLKRSSLIRKHRIWKPTLIDRTPYEATYILNSSSLYENLIFSDINFKSLLIRTKKLWDVSWTLSIKLIYQNLTSSSLFTPPAAALLRCMQNNFDWIVQILLFMEANLYAKKRGWNTSIPKIV